MGTNQRRAVTGVVLLIMMGVLAAVALIGAPGSSGERPDAPPLAVNTIVATSSDGYQEAQRFVGRVEAARQSDLGFELGGQVIAVRVDEGAAVKRGALLAQLDTDRLKARRDEATAAVAETQANAQLAASTLERVRVAHEKNAISGQRLDEAQQQLRASEATLARAEAALQTIDVDIDKAMLRAPYDAIVVQRWVDEGQVVSGGQPLLRLLERTQPLARIGVTRALAASLSVGDAHTLEVDDAELSATVKAVLPQRDAGTRSVDVLFQLDSSLGEVRDGDLAALTLSKEASEPGYWLPLSALTEGSRGLWNCLVVEGSVLARRELVVLYQEEDRVFVRGTLADGERVVSEGLHRLAAGQEVTPQ